MKINVLPSFPTFIGSVGFMLKVKIKSITDMSDKDEIPNQPILVMNYEL